MVGNGRKLHVDNALVIFVVKCLLKRDGIDRISLLGCGSPYMETSFSEQEEIAKSKTLGELFTWDDLTKMKYRWRVAMETLKDNPSWVLFLQEGTERYRIWRISNTKRVATSMTHMDETIFPNPSNINPTRFEQHAPARPYCFVAFRGGPRMCPGYEFARIETLAMIH
ncbi:hypothetical protein HYC85_018382 [Camellia sinensis]|uniref:Cytochrome P450 n=1 Tax=Camellia sinensis TaxID=4442 RepID=A0A7J7GVU9_CAMSI|nr:hypothetical protein HYC85_018382 [Camellia sinensis]